VYKNLLELSFDNTRTRSIANVGDSGKVEEKSEIQLFEELFYKQNGREMSEEQRKLAISIIEEVLEGEI
jgi:exonuclease SbcD